MSKIKFYDIREILEKSGWSVLSTTYRNLNEQMIFCCPEGHTVYSSWGRLRNKLECPVCKNNEFNKNLNEIKPKPHDTIRVLGLDQASYTSGYSIFDNNHLISHGVFMATGDDEGKRFYTIRNWILSMIKNWQIDFIGIEGIQYQEREGITTFQTLARLQGVLIELFVELNIPYMICPTNTWRSYCGVKGRSRADKKKSMQMLAKQWYDISVTNDVADAIGIGAYTSEMHNNTIQIVNWE